MAASKITNLSISLENGEQIDFVKECFDVPQHQHTSLPHLIRESPRFDPRERLTLAETTIQDCWQPA
jgi:hypothetical protein